MRSVIDVCVIEETVECLFPFFVREIMYTIIHAKIAHGGRCDLAAAVYSETLPRPRDSVYFAFHVSLVCLVRVKVTVNVD